MSHKTYYNQGFARGVQVGCSPPWKKSQRGDQGKNLPSPRFLRNLRENLKGGTKGYVDLSRENPQRGDQRIF